MGSILGNRVLRVEDPRMLTVGGTYVEDVEFAGALFLTYVRSPVAHAVIGAIDFADALALPGVVADLHRRRRGGRDRPCRPRQPAVPRRDAAAVRGRRARPLRRSARRRDRVGDPRRRDGRRRSRRPSTTTRCRSSIDPEESRRDEVLLHPGAGTNVVHRVATPAPADFSECEVVVEARIVNQRLTAAPIEARSGAAYWTDDGRLVHYAACQGPHLTRDSLAAAYGLEKSQVRVDHARRRRRVRRQVADLSGGVGARLLRPCRRPAGALDRDPLREHDGDAARAQPGAARPHRRHPRRPRHRLPARRRAGCRRLPVDGRDPAHDDDADGDRLLPHPQRRVQRRVGRHQHVVDHRLPRCGTARGGGRHRAHDRPVRRPRSAWIRPTSGGATWCPSSSSRTRPASEPPTTSATTRRPSSGCSSPPATTTCAPSRRVVAPAGDRGRARHRHLASTSRSRPAVRRPSSARSRSARTVVSRCVRGRRRSARVTTRRGR